AAWKEPIQTHIHVKYTIARGDDTKELLGEARELKKWASTRSASSNMMKFMSDLITQLNRTHTQQQIIAMRSVGKAADAPQSFTEGKRKEPILLQNGTGCCIKESDLRQWTAESMSGKDFSKVKMNFLSSREKQLSRMGVRVPRKEISFSNYLSKCFSNK
ncbi:hypothetical protein FOZ62_006310, partial [Perkinsus olseni]